MPRPGTRSLLSLLPGQQGTHRLHGAGAPGGPDSASTELAAARQLPSARTLRPAALRSLFLRFRDVLQRLVNLLRRHLASAAGRVRPRSSASLRCGTERRKDHGHREQRAERPGPRLLPAPAPRPGCPECWECCGAASGAESRARPVRGAVRSAGLCRHPRPAGTSRARPRPGLGRQDVFKKRNHTESQNR